MNRFVKTSAAWGCAAWLLSACGGGSSNISNNQSGGGSEINNADAAALPGWTLVWQDEFEQAGLPDSSKWVFDTESTNVVGGTASFSITAKIALKMQKSSMANW